MTETVSVNGWLRQQKANELSKNTLLIYTKVMKKLDAFKPVDQITKNDLIDFFEQLKCAPATKNLYKIVIRKFFTDIKRPELVDWWKLTHVKESLTIENVLNREDINKMISTTDKLLFKAFIATAFDSGGRIGEILNLAWQDVKDTKDGVKIRLETQKTDAPDRHIILPFASEYLRALKIVSNGKDNDKVFDVCYDYIYQELKRIAAKANIKKPISPHKLRHCACTDDLRYGMSESVARRKYGWSKNSNVINRYQHLNDTDVNDAQLAKVGKVSTIKTPTEGIVQPERIKLVEAVDKLFSLEEENTALKVRLDALEKKEIFHWNKIAEALKSFKLVK